MYWYVLHVRTGKEFAIKSELERKGYTATAPTKILEEHEDGKWHSKIRQVFPGYVFIRLGLTDEDYYIVNGLPGVIRFLGVNGPEPLLQEEEDIIAWLDNDGIPLTVSDLCLNDGQQVEIVSGPLRGREGTIIKIMKRQRRALMTVTLGGQQRTISLSINVIKSAKSEEG